MNDEVAKARRRRAELRAELADIESFLGVSDETDREPRPYDIADAAWSALHDAQQPMMQAELVEAIEAGGTRIPPGDKSRFLEAVLSGDPRFVNIAGHGYWLAAVDCRRAGYMARDSTARKTATEAQLEDLKLRTSGV